MTRLALRQNDGERILYDSRRHHPILTLPGMRECTILVNSAGKTRPVTGWRLGRALAPHADAPAPLQQSVALARPLPDEYYSGLTRHYIGKAPDTVTHSSGMQIFTVHARGRPVHYVRHIGYRPRHGCGVPPLPD